MDVCTPSWANVSMWAERHTVQTSLAAGCRSYEAQNVYANIPEMIYRTNDWLNQSHAHMYDSTSIMLPENMNRKNN